LLNRLVSVGLIERDEKLVLLKIAIYGGGERGSALAMEVHSLVNTLIAERCVPRTVKVNVILLENREEQVSMSKTILKMRSKHFKKHDIKVIDAQRIATLCSNSVRLLNGKAVKMDMVVNLSTQDVMPHLSNINPLPDTVRQPDLSFQAGSHIWMAVNTDTLRCNSQRRLSMQLEQAKLAGFNAWASSQSLPSSEIKPVDKSLYECYMRILIDWSLDFVFNHDTSGLLDNDFRINTEKVLRAVPTIEKDSSSTAANAENSVQPINKKAQLLVLESDQCSLSAKSLALTLLVQ